MRKRLTSKKALWSSLAAACMTVAIGPAQAADAGNANGEAGEAKASSPAASGAEPTLKKLINLIRFGRDDKAAALLAFDAMAQRLMGEDWGKLSASDQKEMVAGLEKVLRRVSFERGREVFKYLNALRFDPARQEGDTTHVRSVVVIFRDLKKSEVVIDWVLIRTPSGFKVVDTVILGESTADAVRNEEVKPLLAEGGVPALMAALRKKVAEVSK